MENKKVFIGPIEIAGYYANLSKGLRRLGVDCDFYTYYSHPYGYGAENTASGILNIVKHFRKMQSKCSNKLQGYFFAFFAEILEFIWAIPIIRKYDVFIFGFGKSLLWNNLDLYLLKMLNKRVICVLSHGSDARPPYIDGFLQAQNKNIHSTIFQIKNWAVRKAKKVKKIQILASVTIGYPLSTSHFAEKCFINSLNIGKAVICDDVLSLSGLNNNAVCQYNSLQPVRILHAPSNSDAKGSEIIIEAVQRIKNKGFFLEFVLISGMPHKEVIKELQKCDFVIDQLYSDTPMSGFPSEAAFYGKPAVVAGYGFDYLKTLVPDGMWPPSKTCHPDEIEQAIETLIVNRKERLRIGAKAQIFVRKHWSPEEVAKRYLCLIEGNIPNEWWLDPKSVTYLEGAGQSIELTKKNIRAMVERFGVKSLQLGHRPDLKYAFFKFAGIDDCN